jgi:hypothetical protein
VIEFTAVIEEASRGGALVVIPPDVVDALGGAGRIPVRAEFGAIPYQGSIVTYSGRHVLGVLKSIRDELGIGPRDEVLIRIERDSSERTVTIPTELAQAFEEVPGSRLAFEKLSYSHQREHVNQIEDAKKSDTRQRRALRIAQRLGGRSERGDDG